MRDSRILLPNFYPQLKLISLNTKFTILTQNIYLVASTPNKISIIRQFPHPPAFYIAKRKSTSD